MIKTRLLHRHIRTIATVALYALGVYLLSLVFVALNGFMKAPGGWQYVFHEEFSQQNAQPEVFNTLAIHDSSLYFAVTSGFTYSLDRKTGKLRWKHEEQDASIYPAAFGQKNSMFMTNFDGRLYSIDRVSGRELWRVKTPGVFKADTEPILSDDTVFFGNRNGMLYAIDAHTGETKWTFQTKSVDISRFNSQEILLHFGRFSVDEERVYINSSTENALIALDKKNGRLVWRFDNYGFSFQKPMVFAKSVAIMSDKGMYYILDKTSGKKLYEAHIESRFIHQGSETSYIFTKKNAVDAVNPSTGETLWSFSTSRRPDVMVEVRGAELAMAIHNGNTSTVVLLDSKSGKTHWTREIEGNVIVSLLVHDDGIVAIGKDIQCALDMNGNIRWCTKENTHVVAARVAKEGIYVISGENSDLYTIFFIDILSGRLRWRYSSDNIGIGVMQVYQSDLYFVSKDKKSIYMLRHDYPSSALGNKNIRIISEIGVTENDFISWGSIAVGRFLKSFDLLRRQKAGSMLGTPSSEVPVNTVAEFSIGIDDTTLYNKYEDTAVSGIFSDNNGKKIQVDGFYYDKDTWKLRFSPPTVGTWKWEVVISNAFMRATHKGSFEVIDSDAPGFISISQKDSRLFLDHKGNVFEPVGIQDCTSDYNQDGDPLNQWFLGTDMEAAADVVSHHTTSLETYVSTYRKSGFNLFRWGAGNCSFPLWKGLSPLGNRYGVNEGMNVDSLFSELRNHGFHVWMSLFSFSLPFEGDIREYKTQQMLKKYVDYIVARYGAYVDVWELANEITLNDELITFMSEYIRSIDPYGHPITTNWERPDSSSIDISSVHWYSQVCTFCHYEDLNHQIMLHKDIKKPVVFSEQGNWQTNWDHLSAIRLRVRLWVGFFEKMSYIYWNNSTGLWINVQGTTQGPSNIYLGPTERQYVSVFSTFIKNIEDTLEEYILVSEDKIYARESGQQLLGYIYRQEIEGSMKSTTVTVYLRESGKIQWISPATGNVLEEQTVQKGTQILNSPSFSTDIAFKIQFSSQESDRQELSKKTELDVTSPAGLVNLYEVYELTVHTADIRQMLARDDSEIVGYFTDKQGLTHTVKAFYYGLNTWKLRFTPALEGDWKWEVKISGQPEASSKGQFTAVDSDNPGFISISRSDTRLFATAKGTIFMPVGIEGCAEGYNQDGDPLTQWFLGTDIKIITKGLSYPETPLELYLSMYSNSGFNMFRWGAGTCSFPLWKSLSPQGYRYGENEGARIDNLFSTLRRNGFHIWMNLTSFLLPFEKKGMDVEEYSLLKKYLDHVVARYGSYVDVWELASGEEQDEKITTFMSEYIRSIDPYQHPITSISNPVIYSMQGSLRTNWDSYFSMGMRVRLWVGFFKKESYTFWDTSRRMWLNIPWSKQSPPIIPLESAERQYASVFGGFISDIGDDLVEFPLGSPDKAYGFMSDKKIFGYVYKQFLKESSKPTELYINIPFEGSVQWISPVTGEILLTHTLKKGPQILLSPHFSTDIAFKIVSSQK